MGRGAGSGMGSGGLHDSIQCMLIKKNHGTLRNDEGLLETAEEVHPQKELGRAWLEDDYSRLPLVSQGNRSQGREPVVRDAIGKCR